MYFMSEARLVTSYWFGATHESKDVSSRSQLPDMRQHHERIEGLESVVPEVEGGLDEREPEERLLEPSVRAGSPPGERAAAGLFELRAPRS
jgi:hypothetical protein